MQRYEHMFVAWSRRKSVGSGWNQHLADDESIPDFLSRIDREYGSRGWHIVGWSDHAEGAILSRKLGEVGLR